jgi:hypothetical protein
MESHDIPTGSAASVCADTSFATGVAAIFIIPAEIRLAYFSWIVFCAPLLGMLAGLIAHERLRNERGHVPRR